MPDEPPVSPPGRPRRAAPWNRELALALVIAAIPVGLSVGSAPETRPAVETSSSAGPSPGREPLQGEVEPSGEPSPASPPPSSSPLVSSPAPTGKLIRVPGSAPVSGPGPVRTFVVEVEEGLPIDPAEFAAFVQSVLYDRKGWTADRTFAFRRVGSADASFRVTLASPGTTDRLCAPLDTGGRFSCHQGGRSILNYMRWTDGALSFRGDLHRYRIYLINHEVGHAIGHSAHSSCTEIGGRAPLMMQQTKGVGSCKPNPWPLEFERDLVAP